MARMDRLFRGSALMHDKWDERRGSLTCGQMTLLKALPGDVYNPARQHDGHAGGEGYQQDDANPPEPDRDDVDGSVTWETLERMAGELRKERRRRQEVQEELNAVYDALANPETKTEKATAIAARKMEQGKADAAGFVPLYRVEVAQHAGIKEDSVSSHLDKITKWEDSPIEKKTERELITITNTETGEQTTECRRVTKVRLRCARLDALRAIGSARPADPKPHGWGGKREAKCPDHPDAPAVNRPHCSVCNRLLDGSVPNLADEPRRVILPVAPQQASPSGHTSPPVITVQPKLWARGAVRECARGCGRTFSAHRTEDVCFVCASEPGMAPRVELHRSTQMTEGPDGPPADEGLWASLEADLARLAGGSRPVKPEPRIAACGHPSRHAGVCLACQAAPACRGPVMAPGSGGSP